MDIRVEGADQFAALAKRLKEAGNKDLRRELFRGMNRAVKPLRAEIAKSAIKTLPRRGGLGQLISRSKIRVKRSTSARSVGVRIAATSGHDIGALDRGRARHPLFNDRRHWFEQAVPPGWWTEPTTEGAAGARTELLAAMGNVARKIEG